jgi:UDP-N-acetylmuramyl tripeptide synthase
MMIAVKSIKHLLWRNRFSDYPVAFVSTDPADTSSQSSYLPSHTLAILRDRFPAFRAGLAAPTAAGLLATLCLSMQQEKFDLPAVAGAAGAQFWFSAVDPFYALVVVDNSVALLNWVVNRPQITTAEIGDAIRRFFDRCEQGALDPSTRAIVARANVRSIPWFRIGPTRNIQLGQGRNQQCVFETMRSNESALTASYARDKALTSELLNTIFPAGEDGRIPIALVTGTNGKTTTTRMVDHILRAQGHIVGSATTDGVTINGEAIVDGDSAGVTGASIVLSEPTVSAAVLETARGGLLRRGIYVDRCDVAALLNIDREQIEMDGVDTLSDMAQLKRKVLDTAREAVVLNAEDAYCLQISREFPIDRTILFSFDSSNPEVESHIAKGGTAVTLAHSASGEAIVVRQREGEIPVLLVDSIPATCGGIVRFNVANALAAVALAYGMKVPVETIAVGLSAFNLSLVHSPGRFNLIDRFPLRVLFDFANNPPALAATVDSIDRLTCGGRRICAFTSPGNRPDHQIEDCGRVVSGHFDYYICFERSDWRRGRAENEIARRLEQALLTAGIRADQIASAPTQQRAFEIAAKLVNSDDLLVILGTDVRKSIGDLRSAFGLRDHLC